MPSDLEILGPDKAPTDLPLFAINLHVPKGPLAKPVAELARFVRESLSRLQPAA